MSEMKPLDESKPKTVLIVDDDVLFRELLEECVQRKGYEAYKAPDAEHAKKMIPLLGPDAIVTDIRMPGESGVELLKWVKSNHPEIAVIIMTGFSDLLDAVGAAEAGASGFLAKPFHQKELLSLLAGIDTEPVPPSEVIITHCVEPVAAEPAEDQISHQEMDYMRVMIDDFITGSQIQYSIFLKACRNGKTRFLKIAHSGEDLSIERIRAYREKGLQFLYLKREDFESYIGLTSTLAKTAIDRKLLNSRKTMQLVRHAVESIEQNFLDIGISKSMYDQASGMLESTVQFLGGTEAGLSLLDSLKNSSDELYSHCAAVSLTSVLIARGMGWSSTKSISRIALAGLLHDIGKQQMAPELRTKSRSKMSFEEMISYEMHPQRSMEMLSNYEFIPPDVIQAVHQHHERLNGTGFPNHIFDSKIIPMAKIVAVADEFCHVYLQLAEKNPERVLWALERFLMQSDGLSPAEIIALYAALDMKPPEKLKPRVVAA